MKSDAKGEATSNSHFETNFGCCSAVGAATPKIGFKMRIAEKQQIRAPSDMALTNAQPSIAQHRAVMSLRYDCASSGVT